jgi:hypothetical protein
MVDRVITYPGALPQTTDGLNAGKFALVGQAYQDLALLGSSTVVAGLACTPTSPTANLFVNVGVGSIYQMDPTDATAYGDLGTDTNSILKQGILAAPVALGITPPATAGFSQVFLVQAILSDVDAGSLVLSYYNSANPASPFSGPANAGTSNFTTRTSLCAIALKAGTAATTGTQVAPSPDAGYVGLYNVTVANAQTQITSPNIVQRAGAPFFPTLPSVPGAVLNGSWVYAGQDTGAANAYVITFAPGQPIPAAYVAGMGVKFKALVTNTGASTVNVQGLGVIAIKRANGSALAAADITSGGIVELTYDGVNFQMQNYLGTGTNTNSITLASIPYVPDTGTTNALIGTYSPAITSGQQVAGLFISIKLANNITGACTINVNGLGVKTIDLGTLVPTVAGIFVIGEILLLAYDGTVYQVISSSGSVTAYAPGSAYFTTQGTFTWTCPTGVTRVWARVVGAGGGGGTTPLYSGLVGAAGGGGGISEGWYTVVPATVYNVVVGIGGNGQALIAGGAGASGGTSSFGAFTSATGGTGGQGQGASSLQGGFSGVGTGGQYNAGLGDGGTGSALYQGNLALISPGCGGGPGGQSGTGAGGYNGRGPGGGGGGDSSCELGGKGGNGYQGIVILNW